MTAGALRDPALQVATLRDPALHRGNDVMRAIIFELGNVVPRGDHHSATRQLATLSTRGATEEEVYRGVFETTVEADFDRGALSPAAFVQRLRELFKIEASDEQIITAWCDMFTPNPEVHAL